MESIIWQTAGAMSIGLISPFFIVALRPQPEQPPWYVPCAIGLLVFLFSCLWWLIARRWWSVQHAMFIRMRHIEQQLGLHAVSYVMYLDHPETIPEGVLSAAQVTDLKKRVDERDFLCIKSHQHLGVQDTLRYLPILLSLSWLFYGLGLLVLQLLLVA